MVASYVFHAVILSHKENRHESIRCLRRLERFDCVTEPTKWPCDKPRSWHPHEVKPFVFNVIEMAQWGGNDRRPEN